MQETVSPARIESRIRELKGLIASGLLQQENIRGAKVLDWECGDGAFSYAFMHLGAASVVGIDSWVSYSSGQKEDARRKGIVLEQLPIAELSESDFDLIFCNTVTEHIQALQHSVQRVHQLLRSNGVFYTNHDNYYHPGGTHDHGFIQVRGAGEVVVHSTDCWDRPQKCEASADHRASLLKNRPFQWNQKFEAMRDPRRCDQCPYYIRSQPWGHVERQADYARVFPATMRIGGSLNKLTPFQLRQILIESGFQIEHDSRSHVSMTPSAAVLGIDPSLSDNLLRTWMVRMVGRKAGGRMQRTFVGLHVPKCAGTSFLDMVREALPARHVFQNTSIIMNWKDARPEFLDIQDYDTLRVVWGHSIHEQMLYRLRDPILFTGMREPKARLISEARYQVDLRRRQGIDFDIQEWLRRQRNPMCWFIINRFPTLADRGNTDLSPFERARNALGSFHHVYFSENFDQSVKAIFDALELSIPPKQSNIGVKSEISIDVDPEPLSYDIELYEWARDHFGGREFDSDAPMPQSLLAFLKKDPQAKVLEDFLFKTQAGEYHGWKALDEVIEDRVIRATRLLREAEVYRERRNVGR